jgi:DNA helicase-2/ATP-dependent DNA helicase PcrA
MKFTADLHVHSRYSRATSRDMSPEELARWARLKGIALLGTGDFTHPAWRAELREKLEPAAPGLYRLRDRAAAPSVPASCAGDVFFMYQAEISSIYKKDGRTRKVHSLLYAPDADVADEIAARLDRIGNIRSDGRPILGLDARALLALALDVSPECMLIPAHAWTPHFSVFGSVSGFDSLEECFGDLTPRIRAIETGLSSDPPMNRRLSALDGISLISNSDAHSPSKLGREATLFETDLSYSAVARAIGTGRGLAGTIEFFPEEGKYHFDGHRNCGVRMSPEETRLARGLCPVCGKPVTVGVMNRVTALADRTEARPERFSYIVPLEEIIAQAMGRGVNTKGVRDTYLRILGELGNEFKVLMEASPDEIASVAGDRISGAIARMRAGEVMASPGFDGEFGTVRLFP